MVHVIDMSSSCHGRTLATHVSSKGLLQTCVDTHQSLVRDYHRRMFVLSQLHIYNMRLWYVLIIDLQQIALINSVKSLMNVNVWI
jgi:hypothetical protein